MPDDAIAETDQPTRPLRPLWRLLAFGLPMFALGAALTVSMGVWLWSLIQGEDYFSVFVSILVGTSGVILMYEAVRLLMGKRRIREKVKLTSHHLVRYSRSALHPQGTPPDPVWCAALVQDRWQCDQPRGHGPEEAFCIRHAKQYAQTHPSG